MSDYYNPYRNPYPGQQPEQPSSQNPDYPQPQNQSWEQKPRHSQESPPNDSQNRSGSQDRTGFQGQATPQNQAGFQGQSSTQNQAGFQGQSSTQNQAGWQNDPTLKNMDLKKLAFLSELASQSGGKSMDTLLPFLISANKNANSMGLQFSDAETDLIVNLLKSRMSPQEQSRIDMLRKMADILGKK